MSGFFDELCELLPEGKGMNWVDFVDDIIQPKMKTMSLLPHEYTTVFDAFLGWVTTQMVDHVEDYEKKMHYTKCQDLLLAMYEQRLYEQKNEQMREQRRIIIAMTEEY